MSYCRFGEGDVYMYMHIHGGIRCCGCKLVNQGISDPIFHFYIDAIKHLVTHREYGHKVPDYVLSRLQEEMNAEGGDLKL